MRLFSEGRSLCDRGHSFYLDGTAMNVFCFAKREDDRNTASHEFRATKA